MRFGRMKRKGSSTTKLLVLPGSKQTFERIILLDFFGALRE